MKTKLFWNWKVALALTALPLVAATLENTPPADAAADSSAATPLATAASNDTVALPPSAPVMPTDLKLYGGTAEIVKLAQAGVSEPVMLAYITNANLRFSLTSDQIIYLNDLGVPGPIVNAMMQHDAALNLTATVPPASAPGTAATPSDAPPVDMAPQPPAVDDSIAYNPPAYETPYPNDYPTTPDTGYFYDSLAPYGSWVNVVGYGLCWQPTVYHRNHDWRPYGDAGRWLYTDSGWYWQSDYSWGWAAFHYGRWFEDAHRGWVWQPNRVWGPSWVSWRSGGNYIGWAPLPPSAVFVPGIGFRFHNRAVGANFEFGLVSSQYNFIPTARLADNSPIIYGVSRVATSSIFSQSVVVNNNTFENQRVFNHGIDPRQVEAAGGSPMRRALIHDASANPADRRARADHLEKQGNNLVIVRPQLPATPSHDWEARVGRTAASSSVTTTVRSGSVTPASAQAPSSRAATTTVTSDSYSRVHVNARPDDPRPVNAPDSTANHVRTAAAAAVEADPRPRVHVNVRPSEPQFIATMPPAPALTADTPRPYLPNSSSAYYGRNQTDSQPAAPSVNQPDVPASGSGHSSSRTLPPRLNVPIAHANDSAPATTGTRNSGDRSYTDYRNGPAASGTPQSPAQFTPRSGRNSSVTVDSQANYGTRTVPFAPVSRTDSSSASTPRSTTGSTSAYHGQSSTSSSTSQAPVSRPSSGYTPGGSGGTGGTGYRSSAGGSAQTFSTPVSRSSGSSSGSSYSAPVSRSTGSSSGSSYSAPAPRSAPASSSSSSSSASSSSSSSSQRGR